jgi:hypothetical protein
MTENHPITPPLQLVEQWASMSPKNDAVQQNWIEIATQAAQWGADTELEVCCDWLSARPNNLVTTAPELAEDLHAARRPKLPPSLKAEALALLEPQGSPARLLNEDQMGIIRRALEQLDD